jgi:hypothetical protein
VPVKLVADGDQSVLQNRLIGLIPKLDIEVDSNAGMSVGDLIKIRIVRYDDDNTVNESLPPYLIVLRVTHHETRFNYRSRAILGTTYEQLKGLEDEGCRSYGRIERIQRANGLQSGWIRSRWVLGKVSAGIDVGLESINDAIALVNKAEQTIRDAAGNVIKITQDAVGNIIRETTDTAGNVIRETTDKAGNVVREIIKDVTGIGGKTGALSEAIR